MGSLRKAALVLAAVVAVAAACALFAGCSASASGSGSSASSSDATSAAAASGAAHTKYTLHIGTNSQTDSASGMSYEDAKALVIGLALEYVGGYTIYDAAGGWTNDEGVAESESTIVVVLETDDDEAVHKIAAEAARALDQQAILIESSSVVSEYYEAA